MKLENFFLAINVLKWVQDHPNCTIPQLRDFYGADKEKILYKITSYLTNHGFIERLDNEAILPGGPHFFVKITLKGLDFLSDIRRDLIPQSYNLSRGDIMKNDVISSISTEFSKFSYEILINVLHGLLDELDYETRRILNSKKPRINVLIEKCHAQLQEKFSKIIDSKI